MTERVTKEEKIIELAILKAKEILQDAGHLGRLKLDEDVMGEEMKVKKPKKKPSEVNLTGPFIAQMRDLSNIEGKEDKVNDGTMKKSILAAVDDLLKVMAEQEARDMVSGEMNASLNRLKELTEALANSPRGTSGNEYTKITRNMEKELDKIKALTPTGLPTRDLERTPMSRRF